METRLPPLCIADDATFWPWFTWTDFARMPDRATAVVVIPLAGFADWGLGHAYDAEEVVLTHVLRAAAAKRDRGTPPRLLVLPPLRFVLGPVGASVFAVDPPTAHGFITNVVDSVAAAGFTRIVLFNASPWNEELVDAAARDLRIERGLQMFCVNLSALDLDFHPTRSKTRRAVQTLVTYLTQREPEIAPEVVATDPTPITATWGVDEIKPLAGAPATLAEAAVQSPPLLIAAATRLDALFAEIAARPALLRGGAIKTMTA
jgi:creatinine amidohydrolase